MGPMKNNKIFFYQVKDNQAKIDLICGKAQEAILQEKRLLIVVPNEEAARYINTLLWKEPTDSFIPHAITNEPSQEWVIITQLRDQNLNQACRLLNLSSQISPIYQQFEEIYELLDESNEEKKDLSQARMNRYKSEGAYIKII
jgi:DNA polymerase-3 subunit chi